MLEISDAIGSYVLTHNLVDNVCIHDSHAKGVCFLWRKEHIVRGMNFDCAVEGLLQLFPDYAVALSHVGEHDVELFFALMRNCLHNDDSFTHFLAAAARTVRAHKYEAALGISPRIATRAMKIAASALRTTTRALRIATHKTILLFLLSASLDCLC
jgi:hypothetical protein